MMLTGYPVEDLALRASFVDASIAALDRTAARLAESGLGGIAVVVGYLDRRPGCDRGSDCRTVRRWMRLRCCTAGKSWSTSAKHHLPNYGVFDEFRYFVPGDVLPVVRVPANAGDPIDVAVAVCEDLWQDGGPVAVANQAGAALLVVPNASPYERGKDDVRSNCACAGPARLGPRSPT